MSVCKIEDYWCLKQSSWCLCPCAGPREKTKEDALGGGGGMRGAWKGGDYFKLKLLYI